MKTQKYRLTKLSDDRFNGKHPNFILEGMQWEGHINRKPEVGFRFHFGTRKDHIYNHLWTSTVTKILSDGKFKTKNSTYQLIKI